MNRSDLHRLAELRLGEARTLFTGVKVDFEEAIRENDALRVSWSIVKDWSEASRYALDVTEESARDMLAAVGAEETGVLPWLKTPW